MKTFAIAAALAAIPLMAPAAAYADAPNGPRAEVTAGWDSVDGGTRLDDSGVAYVMGVGYDFSISPKSSFGVDAEIGGSDAKDRHSLAPGVNTTYKTGRDLYVGGRYTYAASDKINLFATAGYTNQRIKGSSSLGVHDSQNLDGVRVGAGVQYNLTDSVYWTTSYRYSNYEAGLDRSQILTGIGMRF